MGPFEMVVAIVLIVTIGHIVRARYKANGTRLRLAVLERITVEKENALEREIELLRDR